MFHASDNLRPFAHILSHHLTTSPNQQWGAFRSFKLYRTALPGLNSVRRKNPSPTHPPPISSLAVPDSLPGCRGSHHFQRLPARHQRIHFFSVPDHIHLHRNRVLWLFGGAQGPCSIRCVWRSGNGRHCLGYTNAVTEPPWFQISHTAPFCRRCRLESTAEIKTAVFCNQHRER